MLAHLLIAQTTYHIPDSSWGIVSPIGVAVGNIGVVEDYIHDAGICPSQCYRKGHTQKDSPNSRITDHSKCYGYAVAVPLHVSMRRLIRHSIKKTIRHSVGNAAQIVYGINLRRRLATLLNVAQDSQNISSTWSHTLHKVVQTYDVEMTCQRFIYSFSVTNNHVGPEVWALHIAIWL